MKHKAIIAFTICAVILFGLIAWNTENGKIPKLKLSEIGSTASIANLEIKIPAKTINKMRQIKTAPVYKYVLPDRDKLSTLAASLGCDIVPARFGENQFVTGTNDKGDTLHFTYEPGTGYWNWLNQTVQENTKGQNLPSDEQCQEMAIKKLKELGIYQKRFNTLQIQPEIGIDEQNNEITAAKTLSFYPELDGQVIEGISRIIVSFSDNGEIYEISKYYKDFVKVDEKEVISVDTALKRVQQGDAAFTLGETVEHAVLNNAALTYWEDSKKIGRRSYLQPVWVFEGETSEDSAEKTQFEAIVPALK